MKLYTDGSLDEENCVAGLGYVIELKSGAEIEGKRYIKGEFTSMEVEWYSLMQGLSVAYQNVTEYDNEVEVVVDCKPLVQKIHEPNDMYDDDWYIYRQNVLEMMFQFEDYDLSWEERASTDENERADRLAREALWQGRNGGEDDGGARQGVDFDV